MAYIADLVVVRIYRRDLHLIPRSLTLVQTYSKRVAVESRSGSLVSANVEPFLPVAYSFDRGAAYPHSPSMPFNTFNGLFIWEDPRDDELMFGLAVEYHTKIWEKAIELGVSRREAFFPPNYVRIQSIMRRCCASNLCCAFQSQSITPVTQIYGPNLPRLQTIKRRVDPFDLFSLTGGYKI